MYRNKKMDENGQGNIQFHRWSFLFIARDEIRVSPLWDILTAAFIVQCWRIIGILWDVVRTIMSINSVNYQCFKDIAAKLQISGNQIHLHLCGITTIIPSKYLRFIKIKPRFNPCIRSFYFILVRKRFESDYIPGSLVWEKNTIINW